MGWLWGTPREPSATLTEEQLRQLHRKGRALGQAYTACLKSNTHLEDAQAKQACRGLEVSLMESYASHPATCPAEAERFRACYTSVVLDDSLDYSVCDRHLADMQRCLRRFQQLQRPARTKQ